MHVRTRKFKVVVAEEAHTALIAQAVLQTMVVAVEEAHQVSA